MINLGLVELLAHPRQLAALKSDLDGLLAPAVEEMCRYHTASGFALRRCVCVCMFICVCNMCPSTCCTHKIACAVPC